MQTRTAILLAAGVGTALFLDVAVLGAGPLTPVAQTAEQQAATPTMAGVTTAPTSEATVPPVPTTPVAASASTSTAPSPVTTAPATIAAATPAPTTIATLGTTVAPAVLPTPVLTVQAQAPTPEPEPVDDQEGDDEGVEVAAPLTTVATAVAPPAKVQPAAPTTVAPTTLAASTTSVAPPATAPPTTTVPAVASETRTYDLTRVGGVVTLRYAPGQSIVLETITLGSGWVYQAESNGPRTVQLKFYNTQTGRDAEWKATLEQGRILIEE